MSRSLSILLIGLCLSGCSQDASPVTQPIQFSHKAHIDKGLACDGCHQSVEKASYAGIPKIETCMFCHQTAMSDSPEEEKVRQYAAKGQEIPWQRVYEVPGHVYFSHRRHVRFGEVECVSCHGNIGESSLPITVASVPIRMARCMDCHATNDVNNDCDACHR